MKIVICIVWSWFLVMVESIKLSIKLVYIKVKVVIINVIKLLLKGMWNKILFMFKIINNWIKLIKI